VYDRSRVAQIRQLPIDPTEKGFGGPAHTSPVCAADLIADPQRAASLLSTPHARLHAAALQHNVVTMADYCSRRGVTLYPHGKTTMAPQLWAMQLDAGARGITVATASQARLAREFGVENVLIANEIVDQAAARWLAAERAARPDAGLLCYVDSTDGVERLDRSLRAFGPRAHLSVLLELGHAHGRTGVRTPEAAAAVADAVGRSTNLALAGVAGYEGSLVADTLEATITAARDYLGRLRELVELLLSRGHFTRRPVVTAGGSAYFDVVVETLGSNPDWELVLRSGCYVAHDDGLYARLSPFERGDQDGPHLTAAIEVRAPVLSVPEPGLAVLGVGRRDVSFDAGNPVLHSAISSDGTSRSLVRTPVARLFDQHAVVTLDPTVRLAVGDEVGLGVSHPCTTFDKWRWIPVVDPGDGIVDVIRTYF
jgi:D-serine deaminase-like pyridoxal phosphate-dependent protein